MEEPLELVCEPYEAPTGSCGPGLAGFSEGRRRAAAPRPSSDRGSSDAPLSLGADMDCRTGAALHPCGNRSGVGLDPHPSFPNLGHSAFGSAALLPVPPGAVDCTQHRARSSSLQVFRERRAEGAAGLHECVIDLPRYGPAAAATIATTTDGFITLSLRCDGTSASGSSSRQRSENVIRTWGPSRPRHRAVTPPSPPLGGPRSMSSCPLTARMGGR